MEVHHHPKLGHANRKFREYFTEFLMIFLAVVLGFFAESVRERINDRSKETEYIVSLVHNLEDDSTNLASTIDQNNEKVTALRKLMSLGFADMSQDTNRRSLYRNCVGKSVGFYSIFKSNDATMVQLKNEGLRLIHKDHVSDSIARYDNEMKIIYAAEDLYNSSTETCIVAAREVLNYAIYYDTSYYNQGNLTGKSLPFITDDPQKIKLLFNKVDFEMGATKNYIYNLQLRLPFTARLIAFLKKEYDLN